MMLKIYALVLSLLWTTAASAAVNVVTTVPLSLIHI